MDVASAFLAPIAAVCRGSLRCSISGSRASVREADHKGPLALSLGLSWLQCLPVSAGRSTLSEGRTPRCLLPSCNGKWAPEQLCIMLCLHICPVGPPMTWSCWQCLLLTINFASQRPAGKPLDKSPPYCMQDAVGRI